MRHETLMFQYRHQLLTDMYLKGATLNAQKQAFVIINLVFFCRYFHNNFGGTEFYIQQCQRTFYYSPSSDVKRCGRTAVSVADKTSHFHEHLFMKRKALSVKIILTRVAENYAYITLSTWKAVLRNFVIQPSKS